MEGAWVSLFDFGLQPKKAKAPSRRAKGFTMVFIYLQWYEIQNPSTKLYWLTSVIEKLLTLSQIHISMKSVWVRFVFMFAFYQPSAVWAQKGVHSDSLVSVGMVMDSQEAERTFNAGLLQFQEKDFQGAKATFSLALSYKPLFENALLNRAFVCMELKQYALAQSDFTAVLNLNPSLEAAELGLAQALANQKKFNEALEIFSKLKQRGMPDHLPYYESGMCFFSLGEYDKAMQEFTHAVELKPDFVFGWNDLASTKRMQKDFEGAKQGYLKAIEMDPRFAIAWANLGSVLRIIHDYAGAIEAYTKALSFDPKNFLTLNNRGTALLELGMLERAEQDFKAATRINPQYALAFANLGVARFKGKDYNGSIDASSRAIQLDPLLANAYLNRGVAKEAINDFSAACKDWTIAAKLGSEKANGYMMECTASEP